ncbi:hypothetical protein ACFPRL_27095 [Pseudoclavibacter helvolus]
MGRDLRFSLGVRRRPRTDREGDSCERQPDRVPDEREGHGLRRRPDRAPRGRSHRPHGRHRVAVSRRRALHDRRLLSERLQATSRALSAPHDASPHLRARERLERHERDTSRDKRLRQASHRGRDELHDWSDSLEHVSRDTTARRERIGKKRGHLARDRNQRRHRAQDLDDGVTQLGRRCSRTDQRARYRVDRWHQLAEQRDLLK